MGLNKVFILTQYYPPETGAPQNRLSNLARYLSTLGIDVNVLTALPNYPSAEIFPEYRRKLYCEEELDGIRVLRSWLYVSKSRAIISRLLNYFSFVISSFFLGLKSIDKNTDLIICESPPLFLGISAVLLKKVKGTRLLFNVSDLWPESAEELGLVSNKMLLSLSRGLEEYLYRSSDLISGQTQGIVKNISARVSKPILWYRNGFDFRSSLEQWEHGSFRADNGFMDDDFLLFYGGILGHAQGLETCLRAAKILKENKRIYFLFYGTGPEEASLKMYKEENQLDKVIFYGHKQRNELLAILNEIDVGIIPLKDLPIFRGAIPSKIFEVLAWRKPILLGVKGEAKELFIDIGKAGYYYEPENEKDLADKIDIMSKERERNLSFGENGYRYIYEQFNQSIILDGLYNFINKD